MKLKILINTHGIINEIKNINLFLISKLFFTPIFFYIFFKSLNIYPGNKLVYLLFSFVSLFYLFYSMSAVKYFFHIYLSLFLFLGFWLKYSLVSVYKNSFFQEGVGNFDFSSKSLDDVLIISTISIFAFLFSNFFYERKIKQKSLKNNINYFYLINDNKLLILFSVLFLSLFISFINFKYSIYQKGIISNENLYFLRDVFAWFYQVGFALMFSLLLDFNLYKKKFENIIFVICISFFIISVSFLSRNYFFSVLPFFLSIYIFSKNYNLNFEKNYLFYISILLSLIFFFISFYAVNNLRVNNTRIANLISKEYIQEKDLKNKQDLKIKEEKKNIENLLFDNFFSTFLNRFVGIDGLMAIYSYPKKNYQLFISTFSESLEGGRVSFYDDTFLESVYKKPLSVLNNKNHFITLPGIIGYLYIPGSIIFAFCICLFIGFLFCELEKIIDNRLKMTTLTVSVSYLISYRLIHFGYVPSQTYKLFLGIFIFIIITYYVFIKKK